MVVVVVAIVAPAAAAPRCVAVGGGRAEHDRDKTNEVKQNHDLRSEEESIGLRRDGPAYSTSDNADT